MGTDGKCQVLSGIGLDCLLASVARLTEARESFYVAVFCFVALPPGDKRRRKKKPGYLTVRLIVRVDTVNKVNKVNTVNTVNAVNTVNTVKTSIFSD